MRYEIAIGAIMQTIFDTYGWTSPKEDGDDVEHILWMLDEIPGIADDGKAGRWIGWVLANVENMGLLTNEESRRLIRLDVGDVA